MSEQLTYEQALEQLRGAYEREKIYLTVHISTLQVSINQQSIKIKELEEELDDFGINHRELDCHV